ncbi:phenylacetate--CoA ligase [Oryzomonas japonica]|uniref:Phenylacetate-coenzyme A ligase n=1 Tax=Oryzomonas japonica TaxID=2603858 RepID=A0A7J4ZSX2_9BACT|nr:phenylacetate--CoA ligase [Oryzomonas japonica]KAB0666456.1 phenylacetate--CoA ligase [Oryzomonas japonica]
MLNHFPPKITTIEELPAHQLRGLQWTVRHAFEHSAFYHERLSAAGIGPDDITSLDDLRRLPFTTADDLAAGYPFALRAADFADLVRIHASSGTTGKRKVLCYTRKDVEDWQTMFARCYELAGLTRQDRVQIAVGYGLWTAGIGFQQACERFGALAVPVGPGNLELQTAFLIDLQSTVFCCTASMGLLLAEEVQRKGLKDKLNLRKIILGAERSSSAMLDTMRDCLGVEDIYDVTGLTEVYGPGTGLSCRENSGIHYWADYYILEVLDPLTLEPAAPGEIGEMVFTTLCKEGAPLMRYRSRDLTRLLPGECPCGCFMPRHDRILGRSDDVTIFRGVNIYPGQIDEALNRVPGIGSEYQVLFDRGPDGRDSMLVRVERAHNGAALPDERVVKAVAAGIKHTMLVSCTVEVLAAGTLPRSERKTRRIFDNRTYE